MSWWQPLYDDLLAEMLLVRSSPEELIRTSAFLVQALELSPGARVFDQCAGIGNVTVSLAEQGFEVVSVEQCEAYVARARAASRHLGGRCEMVTGDAFEFVPSAPVHGAFNWWTSFGYTPDDRRNAEMLARAFESLVPGGKVALDFMNLPGVLRAFQRDVVLRRTTPDGECVLLRETELDLPRGMMNKTWTYFLARGKTVTHTSAVRLYLPHQLRELLLGVGFEEVEFFGGVEGEPLTLDTLRCIAVARRPRA